MNLFNIILKADNINALGERQILPENLGLLKGVDFNMKGYADDQLNVNWDCDPWTRIAHRHHWFLYNPRYKRYNPETDRVLGVNNGISAVPGQAGGLTLQSRIQPRF